jgi:hypothetical protein
VDNNDGIAVIDLRRRRGMRTVYSLLRRTVQRQVKFHSSFLATFQQVIDLKMSEVEVEFDAAHDGWRVWVDGWVSGKWFG